MRTDYALCVYDQAGTLIDMDVPSNAVAWQPVGTRGFRYRDLSSAADGAVRLVLRGDAGNRTKVTVRGKGAALPDPSAPAVLPVTAQVVNSETGVCWSATWAAAVRNDATILRLVSP
jgi:hypothetical protein